MKSILNMNFLAISMLGDTHKNNEVLVIYALNAHKIQSILNIGVCEFHTLPD